MSNTEIIPYQTLHAIVQNYQEATKEVSNAFESLQKAKKRLKATLGDYHDTIIPTRFSNYDIDDGPGKSITIIKRNTWHYIFNKTEVLNLISESKKSELERQMESGEMPDVTLESVRDTLEYIKTNVKDFADEAIREAFNYLRPRSSEFKTNSEFEVGHKVIINYAVNFWNDRFRLDYGEDRHIRCIDNAFSLLDGKGPVKYPGDLVTTIRSAMDGRKQECETAYFKCKWLKKSTLHIEIKRSDLLMEFNRVGGGNMLKA